MFENNLEVAFLLQLVDMDLILSFFSILAYAMELLGCILNFPGLIFLK